MQTIETGHTANIFCTKFLPETSDEVVVSGAADAEVKPTFTAIVETVRLRKFAWFLNNLPKLLQVRLFDLSRLNGRGIGEAAVAPIALFQCHNRRVKKLAVRVPTSYFLVSHLYFFTEICTAEAI